MKSTEQLIIDEIKAIPDPEIPVITIEELGILKNISIDNQVLNVTITPTYTGCPAMQHIENDIKKIAEKHFLNNYKIITVLSPAWTTDWISDSAKEKLRAYGIAPPEKTSVNKAVLLGKIERIVKCPQCGSANTEMINQFGSTACKALYKCKSCLEPFDYFKCL
ncbi:MAG TPA: phenylacetate-CoA oxygenase subunit PaaJ [Bacteroidia bacterium]|nr:phenylacetate-CoA oxygenase subunit PaaJ [Bacteroidia bacterium]